MQRGSGGKPESSRKSGQSLKTNPNGTRSQKNLHGSSQRPPSGKLIETVSLDPSEEKKRLKLKKFMKNQIVKKTEPQRDPYANKDKERSDYMKKI